MTVPLAVYWCGLWHVDPRQEAWKGRGWNEWQLIRDAIPRFEGHRQPIVPTWGYVDDSDPAYFAEVAELAVGAGIDAFIVDWYWYDGPFLNAPLDESISVCDTPLQFALMWANHDWRDVFPAPHEGEATLLARADVTAEQFRILTQHVLERYMSSPRYWRVDGAAYYSIFDLAPLVGWLGGVEAARREFDGLRLRAGTAGVGELHLAAVSSRFEETGGYDLDLVALGIDSVNDYNWAHLLGKQATRPYSSWREEAERGWESDRARFGVPIAPNVSVGWDSTPRTPLDGASKTTGWPFVPVIVDNTSDELEIALRAGLEFAARQPPAARYLSINAWNEWTEGSYLEPDNHWGTTRIDAIRRVFATRTTP